MRRGTLLTVVFLSTLVFFPSQAWSNDAIQNQKLDQVLQKQDEILKALSDLKEELQVVKVRATNG